MSELLRQSVLKKNVLRCLVFIVKRGNKSTSTSTVLSASSLDNMVIATTGFHCRTLQRLAPPNVSGSAWMRLAIGFNWHKSCVDANQPSTIFWLQHASTHLGNVRWNLHPRQGWKEHEKNRNQAQDLPLQFSMPHSFEKRKQSRASALKFYQRRRHKFLEGPGTKKNRVWYGKQSHQTRTMFDSLLGVQPHLISRVPVGCACYKLYHYIPFI